MAYERQTSNNNRNNNQTRADAFLNITITDSHGVEHRLRRGIPLELTNLVERSLINKAMRDPKCVLNISGSVHVVPDVTEDTPDIEF